MERVHCFLGCSSALTSCRRRRTSCRAHTRAQPRRRSRQHAQERASARCVNSTVKRRAARPPHLKVWPLLGAVGHALVHQLRKRGRRVRGQPQAALADGDRDDDLRAVHAAPGALARPHLPAQDPERVRVCAGTRVSAPGDEGTRAGRARRVDRRLARQARGGARRGKGGALTARLPHAQPRVSL
jgi:hypothetical protein